MTDNKYNETKEAIAIGLKIGFLLLIPLLLFMAYFFANKRFVPANRPNYEVAPPEEQAVPQNKVAENDKINWDKAYNNGDVLSAINNLKSIETLFAGAEVDIKNGNINGKMDVYSIGAMLEIIYSTAQSIQDSWDNHDSLSPEDISHLKSMEARLSSFQKRAFPKMRLAFKNRTKETLWVHDVNVLMSGAGNTILTLHSFQFAANANIRAAQEQIFDLVTRLRFKKTIYATDEYADKGTAYKLDTPADSTIAIYNGNFQKLDRKRK